MVTSEMAGGIYSKQHFSMSYGFQMFVVLVSLVLSYRQLGLLCLKSFIVTWSYLIQLSSYQEKHAYLQETDNS